MATVTHVCFVPIEGFITETFAYNMAYYAIRNAYVINLARLQTHCLKSQRKGLR